jgi:hypothetical protein
MYDHFDIKNATLVTLCGKVSIMLQVLFFNDFFFRHNFLKNNNFHLDYLFFKNKFIMKCNSENKTPVKLCNQF